MECLELFSIPVFKEKISLDNGKLAEFCLLQESISSGSVRSNSGGWQSNNFLDPPPELKDLIDIVLDFSVEICNFLEIEETIFSNAWININRYMEFNWPHIHPLSALSGVYYVKTPENCGNIEFENFLISTNFTELKLKNHNRFNSQTWWLPSEEGTLYIFPSWLRHKVYPNMNKFEERISISFNLDNY